MKYPSIITVDDVVYSVNHVHKSKDSVTWHPARCEGYPSLRYRIKAAWLVFTGRADALIWPGDQ
jgi:hypothetical protein